jgi:hypothetical protein
LEFEFARPLHRIDDFERILKSRLEKIKLVAPSVGVRLRASELSPQVMNQVGMNAESGQETFYSEPKDSQDFSVLLSELQSDLGPDCVGILALKDSHLPEERSNLQGFRARPRRKNRTADVYLHPCPAMDRLTRILPQPKLLLAAARKGESFGLGSELYTIENLRFIQRLDGVNWWTENAPRRDYYWAGLSGLRGYYEALLFVERGQKTLYLQGWAD